MGQEENKEVVAEMIAVIKPARNNWNLNVDIKGTKAPPSKTQKYLEQWYTSQSTWDEEKNNFLV